MDAAMAVVVVMDAAMAVVVVVGFIVVVVVSVVCGVQVTESMDGAAARRRIIFLLR